MLPEGPEPLLVFVPEGPELDVEVLLCPPGPTLLLVPVLLLMILLVLDELDDPPGALDVVVPELLFTVCPAFELVGALDDTLLCAVYAPLDAKV